MSEKIMLARK